MLNFGKTDKDPWNLTASDLPPEALMRQEPRLQRLDENPVFRMTTMRRKRGIGHGTHPMQLVPGLFIVFVHFVQATRLPLALRMLGPAVLGGVIVAVFLSGSKRTGGIDPLGGNLDRSCRVDLMLAGVPPEVALNGRWGSLLNRRRIRWENLALNALYGVGLAACALGLVLAWPGTAFAGLLPLVGVAGLLRGYARHPIPRALQTIKFQTRALRNSKEWAVNWRAALGRTLRRLWWITLLCVAVAAAVFAAFIPVLMMINSTNDPLAHAALRCAGTAFCALVAPWAGSYAGRRLDRKRDEMYREAVDDTAFLLEALRVEEFEKRRM